MRTLFFTLLLFLSLTLHGQRKVASRITFNSDTTELNGYYFIGNNDSLWLEKPLGTFKQRIDSIISNGGSGTNVYASGGLYSDEDTIKLGGSSADDITISIEKNSPSLDINGSSDNMSTNYWQLYYTYNGFTNLLFDDNYGSTVINGYLNESNNNYLELEANSLTSSFRTQLDTSGLFITSSYDTTLWSDNHFVTKGWVIDKMYDTKPHAVLYRKTDLTISADQNVWYKITGLTIKDTAYITVQGDSVKFQKTGHYSIDITISFSGLNNEVWELGVFKGGTLEEPSQLRYTGTSDIGNMSCSVGINVTANQWLSFKIRNTTDGDDPTIKRVSIRILPISLDI